MSDLISRSVLLERLKEYSNNDWNKSLGGTFSDCVDTCIDYVENAPTAYDVDKVVEQVEAEMRHCEAMLKRHNSFSLKTYHKGLSFALDIIRAGGKE